MSGPKVVRIVTREEILEICRGQLARVDAALAEWIRVGKRNDCIDENAIAAAQDRRDALAALIAAERFIDLQKQAPIEEAFLRSDQRDRLFKVAEAQALARFKERREREAAAALLKGLRAKGAELEPDLEEALERGDAVALSRGLLMLGDVAPQADAELTAKLREGGGPSLFSDWVSAQPASPADRAFERIETRIAEIAQYGLAQETESWTERLREATFTDGARRDLILDNLEVETGRSLDAARERAEAQAELRLMLAEATTADLDVTGLGKGSEALSAAEASQRAAAVRHALDTKRKREAVDARRTAVLEGLSGLGYEVSEGMATIWESEGRLVLRSAARPDYGVELSGADRFQMRPVAFDANGIGPDPSRDRDAETIWCGDVGTLSKHLAELGDGLSIERSLPVGQEPLKRIPVVLDSARTTQVPGLRERTLK